MVSILHFLRVFLPFDVRNGLSAIQVVRPTDVGVQAKVFTEPVVTTMYRAPKVKFLDEPPPPSLALVIPKTKNVPITPGTDRPDQACLSASVPAPRERRFRRARSAGVLRLSEQSPVRDPQLLFNDSMSYHDESPSRMELQALKAEMYDREINDLKQTVDELTEELTDARDILTATEKQVESILSQNIKLQRSVKEVQFENTLLTEQLEEYRQDLLALHEWIYSVQVPLNQHGLYPSALNNKLHIKMKVPRAFPRLSPDVSSRLSDFSTPRSTSASTSRHHDESSPRTHAERGVFPRSSVHARSLSVPTRPTSPALSTASSSSSCSSSSDGEHDSSEQFFANAIEGPMACSSPTRTRSLSGSPSPSFSFSDPALCPA